ncbi:MAG TPA: rhodanese-like domain-containing protein [Rectinemataceae bacterium]|nr:rhodanese-like domain-containing protein [Rectinemataceae bacterium]
MNPNLIYVAAALVLAYLLYQRLTGLRRTPPAAVLAKIRAGARIVDVRTPGEFSSGSYRKAKNIPLADLPSRLDELGPKDKPIVLYCASGSRSSRAGRILKKAGFSDVVNAGGLAEMPRN